MSSQRKEERAMARRKTPSLCASKESLFLVWVQRNFEKGDERKKGGKKTAPFCIREIGGGRKDCRGFCGMERKKLVFVVLVGETKKRAGEGGGNRRRRGKSETRLEGTLSGSLFNQWVQ